MNKPYHERPDWILKSIVYFCDNYTIDGKSLREMKRKAIKTYKNSNQVDVRNAFCWSDNEVIFDFWHSLYWLQGGTGPGAYSYPKPCIGAKCPPWTDYEKRKIAKMPRVK